MLKEVEKYEDFENWREPTQEEKKEIKRFEGYKCNAFSYVKVILLQIVLVCWYVLNCHIVPDSYFTLVVVVLSVLTLLNVVYLGSLIYAALHKSEKVKQVEANQVKILVCDLFELEVNKNSVLNQKTRKLETVYDYYGKLKTENEKCNKRVYLGHKPKKEHPNKLKMVYYEKLNEYIVIELR